MSTDAENEYKLASDTTLTTSAPDGVTVDASKVDALKALTTDFAATVNTPATAEVVKVNNVSYQSTQDSLTVAATADSSTLTAGTVMLTSGGDTASVQPSGTDAKSVASTNGAVIVTVADGTAAKVEGIAAEEEFKFGDTTYFATNVGLFQKGDIENKFVDGQSESLDLTTDPTLKNVIVVTEAKEMTLTGVEGIAVTSDSDVKVADVFLQQYKYRR